MSVRQDQGAPVPSPVVPKGVSSCFLRSGHPAPPKLEEWRKRNQPGLHPRSRRRPDSCEAIDPLGYGSVSGQRRDAASAAPGGFVGLRLWSEGRTHYLVVENEAEQPKTFEREEPAPGNRRLTIPQPTLSMAM